MLGQADFEAKIGMADDVINGTDDVPGWDDVLGLPLPGEVIADD